MRRLAWAFAVLFASCGAEEPPPEAAAPRIAVRFEAASLGPAAATGAAALPVELVFRFVGPDGAREQRVAYEARHLSVGDLRAGRWQVSGDGLDEAGLATWRAPVTLFEVREDRSTPVELRFAPVAD